MDSLASIESSCDFAREVDGAVPQACQLQDGHRNCSPTCTVCRALVHSGYRSDTGHFLPSGKADSEYLGASLQAFFDCSADMGHAISHTACHRRSCLKTGCQEARTRKQVSFGFGVSFWFPACAQLQIASRLPSHGLSAPHEVLSAIPPMHLPFWDFGHVHLQAIPAPFVESPSTACLSGPITVLSFAPTPTSESGIPEAVNEVTISSGKCDKGESAIDTVLATLCDGEHCEGDEDLVSVSGLCRIPLCSSSVGFVSELSVRAGRELPMLPCSAEPTHVFPFQGSVGYGSGLGVGDQVPICECARRKPQSKQAAFRLGAAPYQPPPRRNPGLHRPLSEAGHFRVAEPQALALEEEVPNPYTSFDAVNGPKILAAEADWPSDHYITFAMEAAHLPGTPLTRFLRFELVDYPGPQVALTQDHGAARFRALVFDFRPLQGQVEVIDSQPRATVLEMLRLSSTIADVAAAEETVAGHACTTLVNGVIAAPRASLPDEADLILFQLWQDGAPLNTWRPFQFGDARPPVPPIPEESAGAASVLGCRALTKATEHQPAAIPRYVPATLDPETNRYSFLDVRIGVTNRHKPPPGNDQACVFDALAAVPRGAQPPLGARVIGRPLPGLFEPQVIVTRVTHATGWHTIAIDLRPVNLGIKVINVRLGSSIRQLFAYDSPLQQELVDLGRGEIIFAYMMNLEPCLLDTAFHVRSDSITLTPLTGPAALQSASSSNAPQARWARRLHSQPAELATSVDEGMDDLFTVYDTVHHFRILRCERSDTPDLLIARAISLTPEVPEPEGHLLLHGISDLPFPQIILSSAASNDVVVPLLYKVHPPAVCTVAVPLRASAFEVAYHASRSCRPLWRTASSSQEDCCHHRT